MKKVIIALAIAASLTVPQAFANESMDHMKVSVDSLNVRSSAMVGNNRVGVLHMGDVVSLESRSADGLWCKVSSEEKDWKNMYVACRYLTSKDATVSSSAGNGWMEINGARWAGIKLNVRSSASFGDNRIGFANEGDELWVLAKSNDGAWCKVKWEKNGHTKGYVACRLLTK